MPILESLKPLGSDRGARVFNWHKAAACVRWGGLPKPTCTIFAVVDLAERLDACLRLAAKHADSTLPTSLSEYRDFLDRVSRTGLSVMHEERAFLTTAFALSAPGEFQRVIPPMRATYLHIELEDAVEELLKEAQMASALALVAEPVQRLMRHLRRMSGLISPDTQARQN